MGGFGRWGRRGGVARLEAALPRSLRHARAAVGWAQLVGDSLAEVTALVGVTDDGTIRVATAHESARREIVALSAHVIAAWNGVARQIRGPQAQRLEAWVARDFQAQEASPQGGGSRGGRPAAAAPREPSDASLVRARGEADGVRDAAVRERLARIRALTLDQASEAPPEPSSDGPGGDGAEDAGP